MIREHNIPPFGFEAVERLEPFQLKRIFREFTCVIDRRVVYAAFGPQRYRAVLGKAGLTEELRLVTEWWDRSVSVPSTLGVLRARVDRAQRLLASMLAFEFCYVIRPELYNSQGFHDWSFSQVREMLGLPTGGTAIDLGAGTGVSTLKLSPYYDRVIAIEPLEANLDTMRASIRESHTRNIEVRQGQNKSIPVDDDSANLVFSAWGFGWDFAESILEVDRVVRSGGDIAFVGVAPPTEPHERSTTKRYLSAGYRRFELPMGNYGVMSCYHKRA